MATADALLQAADELRRELRALQFSAPVTHVYNPLDYAWEVFAAYTRRFGDSPKRAVFLGMNPGPFGMTQTGVPFGEIAAVRDWMKLSAPVGRPAREHPRRPIEGFACRRSEVSGRRLWGWVAATFGAPEAFFRDHFVINYCPLVFLEESGRNRTPDKIPAAEMRPVLDACDRHLRRCISALSPACLVGIGGFADKRLREVSGGEDGRRIGCILHPSPASPAANRGWAAAVERQLADLGLLPPPIRP